MEPVEQMQGTGWFWRAEAPDTRSVGTLSLDDNGRAQLHILKDPSRPSAPFAPMDGTELRILGSLNGRDVTLDGCVEFWTNFFTGEQRLDVPQALLGTHLGVQEEIAFERITLRLDNMFSWTGNSAVAETPKYSPDGKLDSLSYTVEPKPVLEYQDGECTLSLRHRWSAQGATTAELAIRQEKEFSLAFGSPMPLNDLMRRAEQLETLVSIATNRPSSVRRAILSNLSPSGEAKTRDNPEVSLWRFRPPTESSKSELSPHHLLFSLDDLGGRGGIARWFAIADKHPVAVGSLASQRSGQFSYVENRLQNVTNAAETYHRGRFTNGMMPKEDFKSLRESLVSCVPSEHQEWLNEKLAHANEKRLHDRILELTEYIGDTLTKVIPDASLFCKQVTSQRNSIAHDDTPKRRLEAARLHQLSEAVYFLVVLCLLKDVEMPQEVLDRVLESVPLATLAWHLAR